MVYRLERFEFQDPLFRYVDTCVVLTMMNSPRRAHYMEQLRRTRPCRQVIVQHNPGFRAKKYVHNVFQDILDAVSNALRITSGPVLILEDDVMFKDKLASHVHEVERFLQTDVEWDIYGLGVLPLVCWPDASSKHIRVESMGASHAWIYHPRMRDRMKNVLRIARSLDPYPYPPDVLIGRNANCFTFRLPLAVQSHPPTENSQQWSNVGTRALINIFGASKDGTRLYTLFHMSIHMGGMFVLLNTIKRLVIVSLCMKLWNARLH